MSRMSLWAFGFAKVAATMLSSQAEQAWLTELQDRLGVAASLSDARRNSILNVLQSEVNNGQ